MISLDQEFLYFPGTQVITTPISLHYVPVSHTLNHVTTGRWQCTEEWLGTTDDSLTDGLHGSETLDLRQ